jgi:hypothetical protein
VSALNITNLRPVSPATSKVLASETFVRPFPALNRVWDASWTWRCRRRRMLPLCGVSEDALAISLHRGRDARSRKGKIIAGEPSAITGLAARNCAHGTPEPVPSVMTAAVLTPRLRTRSHRRT